MSDHSFSIFGAFQAIEKRIAVEISAVSALHVLEALYIFLAQTTNCGHKWG